MEHSLRHDWLYIDVGGTKLATYVHPHTMIHPTPPNRMATLSLIESLINAHQPAGCAIASPGNINQDGIIAPNSANNLSNIKQDWDGFNWVNWLSKRVSQHVLINDAMAQLLGSLPTPPYSETTIGYIGPGTGLGGGFVYITHDTLSPISDGHIFDLILKRDPLDRWSHTEWVMAEDVLSGRGYRERVGVALSDTHHPDRLAHGTLMGRYLTQLVSTLRNGRPLKQNGSAWTPKECKLIQGVSKWVLGGGIMTHHDIATRIKTEWPPHEPVEWVINPIQSCFNGLNWLIEERYGRKSRIRLHSAATASSVWALYNDARKPPADR